jgi:concanavalin A-like lectin/glucanase superfamily protein
MIPSPLEIGLLLSSLLFYADFDSSFDASYSKGNRSAIIEVDSYEPVITSGCNGKFGEAAEFFYEDKLESIWTKDVVRYRADGNFPYKKGEAFDGTIGMWIQTDMENLRERSLIWLDPVHLLAENDPDNGKIWMDFVMSELPDTPIFRFGATVNKKHGDPDGNHVIVIPHIDFNGDSWHHISGTWKNMNSTGNRGVLHLYFDGVLVGEIRDFNHTLDWNIDDWEIRIGLGFKGKIDDFFILNSFLSEEAAMEIYKSGKSLGELLGLDIN